MRKGEGSSKMKMEPSSSWNKPRDEEAEGEKQPFLGSSGSSTAIVAASNSGPVRLTPGYEDTMPNAGGDDFHVRNSLGNLSQPPNDRAKKMSDFAMPLLRKSEGDVVEEMVENCDNVENIAKYNVNKKMRPLVKVPRDRFNLVYLILVIHGVGTLMPWNMFITAKDYFVNYKLSESYTGQKSEYAANFLPYIGFAAQIPNVFFNWLNIFIQIGGSLKTRIVWTIVIEVFLFIFTVILAMLDTSSYPGAFFWLTMSSVVVINMAGGIYQNSVYGIAAKLDYTGAVVLGSNISGTFTSIINLISIAMAPSERTAAIYYFITALFILLTCFDTYFALPLTKFYRYHEMMSAREQENKRQAGRHGVPHRTPYYTILKKCFPQCFNVFMVFFVTLAIFPTVHSDIKMVDKEFVVPEKYYVGVTCFLTFNLFAMLGNMIPALVQWPGPKYLWIPVMLRILFIPFFLLCNYQPQETVRVLLPNFRFDDWTYWSGGVLLGLTSGYFSSLGMMYCPRMVESEYAPIAGMFGAAFLITGIFLGINFSILMPMIISKLPIGS